MLTAKWLDAKFSTLGGRCCAQVDRRPCADPVVGRVESPIELFYYCDLHFREWLAANPTAKVIGRPLKCHSAPVTAATDPVEHLFPAHGEIVLTYEYYRHLIAVDLAARALARVLSGGGSHESELRRLVSHLDGRRAR